MHAQHVHEKAYEPHNDAACYQQSHFLPIEEYIFPRYKLTEIHGHTSLNTNINIANVKIYFNIYVKKEENYPH